jgi:X-X-X-Leu-X-X-Gly heptad repeat protein
LVFPVNVHRMTQTLAATLVIVSRGAPQLQTGSAQLSTTGNVSGFVIFRHNGQEAVVPLESRNASSCIVAPDNINGTATGIAVNAASTGQANIPVTVRDAPGAQSQPTHRTREK